MGATTRPKVPRRRAVLRRLAAALALAALLLLGAMSTAAVAASGTAHAVREEVAPATRPAPGSRSGAEFLPVVLGGIVILAALVPFPGYAPRYGHRAGRY
jgi:type VI protein secretion system component VasK